MSTRTVEYILSLRDRFTNGFNKANAAIDVMERKTSRLRSTMASLLPMMTAIGAVRGAGSIIKLGMDMEQTNLSFEVMLGNAEKAKKLLGDVKAFSVKTPFLFTDVVENTKQLLAYGFTQDKVLGAMKLIGNVASGLKIPFGDMAYLYGTLRAQGRAYAIDLRQFAMRGIPIYEELSKVMKVSVTDVQKLTADGKVGFAQVEQAFINMSSAGGKFYNLMDRQALTTAGKWSNLRDKLTLLAIDYGEKYLPTINKVIDKGMRLSEWLTNNSDKVLRLINTVIKAGKYWLIYQGSLLLVTKAIKLATLAHTASRVVMIAFTRGIRAATVATSAFNMAMKLNLAALALTAIAAIIIKIRSLREETAKTKEVIDKLAISQAKVNDILNAVNSKSIKKDSYTNVELQATIDHLQEIYDSAKDVTKQMKILANENGQVVGKIVNVTTPAGPIKARIAAQMEILRSLLDKQGMSGLAAGGVNDNRETNITSAAPRVITININKLIETQHIETSTLTEGAAQIKKIVIEALMQGINDSQIMQAS